MDLHTLQWIVSSLVAALVFVVTKLVRDGYKQGERDERALGLRRDVDAVRRDLDLLMRALFHRADMELLQKGRTWATMESPIHLGRVAVEAVMPFIDLFVPFYVAWKEQHSNGTEQELFYAILDRFDHLLVEKLCHPLGISQLGCVRLVLEVCKLEVAKHGSNRP